MNKCKVTTGEYHPDATCEETMSNHVDTHEVHIRRGRLINDDPQKRCYNGCYFASHIEWGPWEHWGDYPSEEHAANIARMFARDDQQLKVVEKPVQPKHCKGCTGYRDSRRPIAASA